MATNGAANDAQAAGNKENMAQYRSKKGNRTRPGPKPEEWVGEHLTMGDEFQDTPALSVSEARFIVDAAETQRRNNGKKLRDTEPLLKMMTYMDTFARFRSKEALYGVENVCNPERFNVLTRYEKACLVSLCCGSTDEARLLVPSIGPAKKDDNDTEGRISDNDLQDLLEEILSQDEAGEK
ncbi:hypothetical protein EJ08DRAFT_691628 [Tothia fuscella]|uniref:RNA polymerase Rpb4/RPC9 core domain-containing protein n=1 Tax=Tothia fuscella TaxID=1048955 RepID=A0A9P4U503_9PEZI|nr:hypothetical protein EJ08DRAFT_691628 [Tothia fuscella]